MSEEIEKAQLAKPGGDTIFGKIARKEIPCDFIYEDELVLFLNNLTGDTLAKHVRYITGACFIFHSAYSIYSKMTYCMKQFSVTCMRVSAKDKPQR